AAAKAFWSAAAVFAFTDWIPCWARASTSLMSRLFLAVRSSSSLVLLIIGAAWLRTYFLVEQPALKTTTPASTTVMARLNVKFISFGSFKLRQNLANLGGCGPGKSFVGEGIPVASSN